MYPGVGVYYITMYDPIANPVTFPTALTYTPPTQMHKRTENETHQPASQLLIPAEHGQPAAGSRAQQLPGWGGTARAPHTQRSDPHQEGCHASPALSKSRSWKTAGELFTIWWGILHTRYKKIFPLGNFPQPSVAAFNKCHLTFYVQCEDM